jgi:hypothetical protein
MQAALHPLRCATTDAQDCKGDQHRDEGLAHWRIERRRAAEQDGEDIDVLELRKIGNIKLIGEYSRRPEDTRNEGLKVGPSGLGS